MINTTKKRSRLTRVYSEWIGNMRELPHATCEDLEEFRETAIELMEWMCGSDKTERAERVAPSRKSGNPIFMKGHNNPYHKVERKGAVPKSAGIKDIKENIAKPISCYNSAGMIAIVEETVQPVAPTPSVSTQESAVNDEAMVIKEGEFKKPNGIDVYDYIRKAGISSFHPAPFLEYCERREWKWKDGTPLDWHKAARIWSEWDKKQSYKMRYNLAE